MAKKRQRLRVKSRSELANKATSGELANRRNLPKATRAKLEPLWQAQRDAAARGIGGNPQPRPVAAAPRTAAMPQRFGGISPTGYGLPNPAANAPTSPRGYGLPGGNAGTATRAGLGRAAGIGSKFLGPVGTAAMVGQAAAMGLNARTNYRLSNHMTEMGQPQDPNNQYNNPTWGQPQPSQPFFPQGMGNAIDELGAAQAVGGMYSGAPRLLPENRSRQYNTAGMDQFGTVPAPEALMAGQAERQGILQGIGNIQTADNPVLGGMRDQTVQAQRNLQASMAEMNRADLDWGAQEELRRRITANPEPSAAQYAAAGLHPNRALGMGVTDLPESAATTAYWNQRNAPRQSLVGASAQETLDAGGTVGSPVVGSKNSRARQVLNDEGEPANDIEREKIMAQRWEDRRAKQQADFTKNKAMRGRLSGYRNDMGDNRAIPIWNEDGTIDQEMSAARHSYNSAQQLTGAGRGPGGRQVLEGNAPRQNAIAAMRGIAADREVAAERDRRFVLDQEKMKADEQQRRLDNMAAAAEAQGARRERLARIDLLGAQAANETSPAAEPMDPEAQAAAEQRTELNQQKTFAIAEDAAALRNTNPGQFGEAAALATTLNPADVPGFLTESGLGNRAMVEAALQAMIKPNMFGNVPDPSRFTGEKKKKHQALLKWRQMWHEKENPGVPLPPMTYKPYQ